MLRKVLFYVIMLGFLVFLLEAFGYLVYRLADTDDLYDHRAEVLPRLDEKTLSAFLQSGVDPVLGWQYTGPKTIEEDDCLGVTKRYTVDAAGARVYSGYDGAAARVIVVGDSYTQGAESNDEDAYAAQLADILGVSVANHGVGGYGPTQSFLNFKANIHRYPQAKIAVLGIMYENLYRMINSYRPVLYHEGADYGLKPYMADGSVQAHPGDAAFADVASFRTYASGAFDTDFWAKPPATFPYSLSLIRALGSNYFYFRKLQKQLRVVGLPEYTLIFGSDWVSSQLVSLMNLFAEDASRLGIQPVVVFIPRNRLDTESATAFLETYRERLNPDLLVGDVGQADINWADFNLEETDSDNICHPSPYGYRAIAEYIAGLLESSPAHKESLKAE
jgi:hypothetical protein